MNFRLNALQAVLAASLVATSGASHALTFNLTFTPGTSATEQASFIAGAAMWSSVFSDPVTVDLTVGTSSLGVSILGQAQSRYVDFSYTQVRNALVADASSALDTTAVANLQPGASVDMLINLTRDNPNGAGSLTPYLDNDGNANNSVISITAANARSLGLAAGSGNLSGACNVSCDAFIEFSSDFAWDHDRSDGISANAFDFIGVAAHEIGHALGFVSGVDVLDYFGGTDFDAVQYTFVSTLDLFRYSALSTASGVIDWTADTRAKYFSVDGGATVGAGFSTGIDRGDNRQASHWKDNLGLGMLDPTANPGELLAISSNDLQAMDAIGWNTVAAIPEPSTYALFGAGLGLVGFMARRRRTAAA